MRWLALGLFAVLCPASAMDATTLVPDAIYCEHDSLLNTLEDEIIPNAPETAKRSGSAIIEDAGNQIGRLQIMIDTEKTMMEVTSRINRRMTLLGSPPVPGSSDAKSDALLRVAKLEAKAASIHEFLRGCAATGAEEKQAKIVQARPLSRRSLIEVEVDQRVMQLWTRDSDLISIR